MNLDEIRQEIDKLDRQIVELLKKRMDCSLNVAEWKRANGKAVLDSGREADILSRVEELGGEYGGALRGVYKEIMKQSRELQSKRLGGE